MTYPLLAAPDEEDLAHIVTELPEIDLITDRDIRVKTEYAHLGSERAGGSLPPLTLSGSSSMSQRGILT